MSMHVLREHREGSLVSSQDTESFSNICSRICNKSTNPSRSPSQPSSLRTAPELWALVEQPASRSPKTDCINSVWKVTVDRPATYWTTPMVLSADLSNHLSCLNSFNKIHRAQDASRTSTRGTWQPNGQEVFGWMTSSIAPTDPTGRRLLGTCDRVQIYLLNLLWYTLNLDGFRYIIVSN